MMRRAIVAALVSAVVVFGSAACGSDSSPSPAQSSTAQSPSAGVDREVSFVSGTVTVHASLRMPDGVSGEVPAVVLLAGSGPTDRNGDSKLIPEPLGTLRFVADVLARNGVASLRYDKFGSGATGIGPLKPAEVAGLGFDTFLNEAADAVRFLAAQPHIDKSRLGVIGHSEGALIALAITDGKGGPIPKVSYLGLLAPAGMRFLDILSWQINASIDTGVAVGQVSPEQAQSLQNSLASAIEQLRTTGTVPADLPAVLRNVGLTPVNAKALAQEDQLDPVALAAALPPGMPVLTSCSDKDTQVRCSDVQRLDDALAKAKLTKIHLTDTNHVLKVVGTGNTPPANEPALPFSPVLATELGKWIRER